MYSFTLNRDAISVNFSVETMGSDVCVIVTGGDRPHIGAAALSVARPSLSGDGGISASTSIITVPGHKDDVAAKRVCEHIAKALNKNVAAVCGIHYDGITSEGIKTILDLVDEGAQQVCSMISAEKP